MTRALLLIDDNRSVRESLEFLLSYRGYTIFTAENGAEGIALAAERDIDGALVDVNMPGLNGVEVCRLLRAQAAARGRTLEVWMMTGARTQELEVRARAAGARALLGKPFDFPALFREFDEVLGKTAEIPTEQRHTV